MTLAPHLPQRLCFDIGGFDAAWHRVEWQNGRLIHQIGESGNPTPVTTEVVASPEQWEQFWAEVERAGVWSWRSDYTRPVMDGTNWSLELKHGNQQVESGGGNGYPGSDDEDYPPGGPFDVFQKALMRLTGMTWHPAEED